MYVCSKQSEEGTENPYSHMSHISEGTPYSNNFVLSSTVFDSFGIPLACEYCCNSCSSSFVPFEDS
jgi:hypothetical protein